MKAVDGGEPEHLEAQLATKEREWKELQTLRARQLESSLKDAQEQLSSLRCRYEQCFLSIDLLTFTFRAFRRRCFCPKRLTISTFVIRFSNKSLSVQ